MDRWDINSKIDKAIVGDKISLTFELVWLDIDWFRKRVQDYPRSSDFLKDFLPKITSIF